MRPTIAATVVIGTLALACSEALRPGDVLVGAWTDANAAFPTTLTATSLEASFSTPCMTALFPPLRLDGSLAFHATGVVTRATGAIPVQIKPGAPFTIAGELVGDRVVVGQDTLAPGSVTTHVCNA